MVTKIEYFMTKHIDIFMIILLLFQSKSINFSVPNTIDERSLNKGKNINIYEQLENHELTLRSAEAIGCVVVNIRPKDIQDGQPNLILGLLWQIIKVNKSMIILKNIFLKFKFKLKNRLDCFMISI